MALGTSNRDGGKTSESGHLRALYKGYDGEILSGLAVSQRGAGANMSVDIAIGDAIIPRSDATYGHPSFNDAIQNKTITTADPTNPRRDIVVMYIDYSVTPSTGVSNNTNGVVATKVVAGTPAGSPTDPSDATIQSSVGSGNPYVKLARVRVGAGVTSIGNSVIDDLRTFAHANQNGGWKPLASAWDTATYSAWDSTNKLATINVPDSSIFSLYQKFRYWQTTGGWKYGRIVKIVSSTSIQLWQGPNYVLQNERIYLPGYSRAQVPDGWPADPANWQMSITSTSTASGSASWSNPGSILLALPPGSWEITGNVCFQVLRSNNAAQGEAALSESATALSSGYEDTKGTYQGGSNAAGSNTTTATHQAFARRTFTSVTTVYLNILMTGGTTIQLFTNSTGKHSLVAQFALP